MLSVLFKLKWFFKLYRKRYISAIIVLFVAGFVEIIPPKLIGYSVDQIVLGSLTWKLLGMLLLSFLLLTVLSYTINIFWTYQLFGGAFLVEKLLRSRLMKHFLKMTPTFFEKNRTGDLMARSTNDLRAVSETAGFGILTLGDSTEWLLLLFFTMGFTISWKLTIAALIPLPLIALTMSLYGKKMHERFTLAQDAFGDMNDYVLESVSGVRVLRAYVQEAADQRRFDEITEDVLQKNIEVSKIDALFDPTIKILVGISYLIGLCYGAYLVFHQQITLGELVSFNIYLGMLIWPMFAMGHLINIMQRGSASLDRVEETLAYAPDVRDTQHPVSVEEPEDIEFEHVSFRYPTSATDNLRDVSFTLQRGRTLGIVGKTGSGKTTLLKQLLREYPFGEGAIRISGVALTDIAMDDLFRWFGYVPQDPFLFSRTVRENIYFGSKQPDEQRLREVMEAASLSKDIDSFSQGLDTMVGEKGVSLSGGQKQRVSIARALMADPEMLLLDDALSAVDAKTESEIIAAIRTTRAGKTTLITAHRLSAVMHADLILVMDEGRITERGTHQSLLALNGWYKEQFELQQLEGSLENNPEEGR